jgi:hypothetical protein
MGQWFFLKDAWGYLTVAWEVFLVFHRFPGLGKKGAWCLVDSMTFFPLGSACFPQVLTRRFLDWFRSPTPWQ